MVMTNLMILPRCYLHSRTPRSCNIMEPQRLPSAASSTRFLLDRLDDGDMVRVTIIMVTTMKAAGEGVIYTPELQ